MNFDNASVFSDSHWNLTLDSLYYLPPEVLKCFSEDPTNADFSTFRQTSKPWNINVWQIGATLVEILTGAPLSMRLSKKIVTVHKQPKVRTGAF